jgi:S-adenosyl-L-methionine hydrolase (adenosine-forming)
MQGTPTSRKSGSNAPYRPITMNAARVGGPRPRGPAVRAASGRDRAYAAARRFARAPRGKRMIVLFTDFGLLGPYTGQMKAVLHQMAPGVPIIDLFADAPPGNPKASAYLLAAYALWFAAGTTFLCVVDPGVGGTRQPVMLDADGRWYVGPDNGLFELIERRATTARSFDIDWRPQHLSASFHGRDLFAPVAAMLARGEPPPGQPCKLADRPSDWPDDLAEVVYIDHFGNAMTGLRAAMLPPDARLAAAGRCSSGQGRSATGRPARPSGTRIRTALPRSPSIAGARTAILALRSATRSRLSLELTVHGS